MPFAISGVPLVPVFHLGAAMGLSAPFWDSRDEFGDTNLLVVKPEEGASLARALGKHAMVVMRRHGATVVGGESARARVPHDLFGARTPSISSPRMCWAMSRRSPLARPRWPGSSISRRGRSRAPMNTGCGGLPTGRARQDRSDRCARPRPRRASRIRARRRRRRQSAAKAKAKKSRGRKR